MDCRTESATLMGGPLDGRSVLVAEGAHETWVTDVGGDQVCQYVRFSPGCYTYQSAAQLEVRPMGQPDLAKLTPQQVGAMYRIMQELAGYSQTHPSSVEHYGDGLPPMQWDDIARGIVEAVEDAEAARFKAFDDDE